MRRRVAVLAGIAALLIAIGATATADDEPVSAAVSVDRNVITIGDQIKVTLVIEARAGYQIGAPAVLKTLGDLEVIDSAPPLQGTSGGLTRYTMRYWVTSFRLGDTVVPRIQIDYRTPDGAVASVTTTPIAIRVVSVLRDGEGTRDVKPLKPQLELPGQLRDRLLGWAVTALAVVAAALVGLYLYRRWRHGRIALPGLTPAPAAAALTELRRIAALRLPEKGRADEHYALVALALRHYLADRYGLPAERRTARELHAAMDRAGIERRQANAIYGILRESEAVRFQRAVRQPRHAQQALADTLAALGKVAAAERRETEPVG